MDNCEHNWTGNTEAGYTCRLCGATGHMDFDAGHIVQDTAQPAPTPPPPPTP